MGLRNRLSWLDMEGKQARTVCLYLLPGQILDGGGKVHCRRTIRGWSPGEVIAAA